MDTHLGAGATGKLVSVGAPTLFETSHGLGRPQLRLFRPEDALGDGWLEALKLAEYAPGGPRRPHALQQTLFAYLDAV